VDCLRERNSNNKNIARKSGKIKFVQEQIVNDTAKSKDATSPIPLRRFSNIKHTRTIDAVDNTKLSTLRANSGFEKIFVNKSTIVQ
jgi:hypothetical protein